MTRSSLAAARAALPRALPALAAVLTLAGCAGPGTPSDGGTLADRAQRLRERVEARQARDVVADAQAEHKRTGRPQAVVCMESRAGDRLLLAGDVVAVRSGVPIVKPRGKPTMLARRKGFGPAQGGSGGTSSATYTVTDALVIGAATTSGVRLDLESGTLAVRGGDDSAYGYLRAQAVYARDPTYPKATLSAFPGWVGAILSSDAVMWWTSTADGAGTRDTGLARESAAQVKVTDGSTGVGNLRATALIVGTNGQGTRTAVLTASSALTSGASYTFTGALPDGAIILGVSARITTTVTGPTSVQIGDGSDADRYGIFSTLTANQTLTPADGTASPLEWRAAAGDVVLTAVGGDFTAGVIKIAVHYVTLAAPTS